MIGEDPMKTPPSYNCAAIDMWCFGCTIFEIVTGRHLFLRAYDAKRTLPDRLKWDNHLLQMSMLLGRLPDNLRQHWVGESLYFDNTGRLRNTWLLGAGNGQKNKDGMEVTLTYVWETMEALFDREMVMVLPEWERNMIKDLLRSILQHDPAQRLTAAQALQHPWFA